MREKTNLGGGFMLAGTSLTVNRIGYGAMQLAGGDGDKRVWGPPRDIFGAIALLREVVALGVSHIDTSDFYGPPVNNRSHCLLNIKSFPPLLIVAVDIQRPVDVPRKANSALPAAAGDARG